MPHSTVSFLLVDDDIVSIMSMKRVIKKLRLLNPVVVANDAFQALDILRATGPDAQLTAPYIVILDLNMPKMSGHDFMTEIRNDPELSDTIVFIMSTSDSPADIEAAYNANVAGYILKDGNPNTFRDALSLLGTYSEIVLLPRS